LKRLRAASEAEIAAVPGIAARLAAEIRLQLTSALPADPETAGAPGGDVDVDVDAAPLADRELGAGRLDEGQAEAASNDRAVPDDAAADDAAPLPEPDENR
jgi:hypothetical protein